MNKVHLIKDEYYPFYSIVEQSYRGDVIVELTSKELEQYEFALKTIKDIQSILEERYNNGIKIPNKWTSMEEAIKEITHDND